MSNGQGLLKNRIECGTPCEKKSKAQILLMQVHSVYGGH